jgi:SAM-dependent methyltransferase
MEIAEIPNASGQRPQTGTCVVCGAALFTRAAVRLGKCQLRACRSCGSWTYFPRGSALTQAALHDNDDYFDHPYFKLRRVITPGHRRRCQDVFARLSAGLELSSLQGQRFLDIGCDTGLFLKTAQEEFGIIPVGIDVAERAVEIAREQGVEAYHASIEDAPAELHDFQAVTAIDLIEHVVDPGEFLRQVRGRIRPGGVLYLETPNIRSMVYRFGQALSKVTGGRPAELMQRLFPPQHVQYFTPRSFGSLARASGFDVVRLSERGLPSSDISASPGALVAIGALQAFDRLLGTEILLCAVLRRPSDTPSGTRRV